MKSNKKFGRFGAKGYYIALILCAAAIGISGYVFYRNNNQNDPQLQDPSANVGVIQPGDGSVPVVGTQPGNQLQEPSATQPNNTPVPQPLKTIMPLEGQTIGEYAMDCLAYNETTRDWRTHDGIDIAAEAGTTVCAAAAGTVYATYTDDRLGTTVVIQHQDGYVSVYSSLRSDLLVQPGDQVILGQAIGAVANTAMLETAIGDHLHFSVTCNGESMDPEEFLNLK